MGVYPQEDKSIVRETLLALVELQKIDHKVLEVQKGVDAIPPKIKTLEDGLDQRRASLGELNAQLDGLREELSGIEGKNAEEQAKHRKWKARLNDLRSPRDFQALSREIEMGERAVSNNEERMGELRKEIDDKELEILSRQEHFEEREREVLHQIRGLRATQTQLKADAAATAKGREDLLADLPERIQKSYARLQKQRGGVAVALVHEGVCNGCNMAVRSQQLVEMLRFDRLDTCPSCKRILIHGDILPVDDAPEEADA